MSIMLPPDSLARLEEERPGDCAGHDRQRGKGDEAPALHLLCCPTFTTRHANRNALLLEQRVLTQGEASAFLGS